MSHPSPWTILGLLGLVTFFIPPPGKKQNCALATFDNDMWKGKYMYVVYILYLVCYSYKCTYNTLLHLTAHANCI